MNDTALPASPKRLFRPRNIAIAVVAVVAAVAIALFSTAAGLIARRFMPQSHAFDLRYETALDILALYRLQVSYKQANGTYANDLDSLLSLSPDRAAMKARMAGHLDINTLAVVGNADKFKLEANVLDAERTLIKINGPIPKRVKGHAAPIAEPSAAAGIEEGAPIAPRPAR